MLKNLYKVSYLADKGFMTKQCVVAHTIRDVVAAYPKALKIKLINKVIVLE